MSARPATVPVIVPCLRCSKPMQLAETAANHDKPRVRYLHCQDCGTEERHRVVAPAQRRTA